MHQSLQAGGFNWNTAVVGSLFGRNNDWVGTGRKLFEGGDGAWICHRSLQRRTATGSDNCKLRLRPGCRKDFATIDSPKCTCCHGHSRPSCTWQSPRTWHRRLHVRLLARFCTCHQAPRAALVKLYLSPTVSSLDACHTDRVERHLRCIPVTKVSCTYTMHSIWG